MSLLDKITNKKKSLKHCSTTITTLTGDKFVHNIDSTGKFNETKLLERHAGYVEDFSPDLQVAQVLPFLAFGSQDVAADLTLLKCHRITHVLSIGVDLNQKFDLVYKYFDLLDLPASDLLEIIPETNSFIDAVRDGGGNVFVHCNAGCSRAPSVVIAYLMYFQCTTFAEAFVCAVIARYIRPNEGFRNQLLLYEKLLKKKTPDMS